MENLFRTDYTVHFSLAPATVTGFVLSTNHKYFEVEDNTISGLVIHTTVGAGMARFNNPSSLQLTIVNYDKFLTSLPHIFQEGKKRCDLIISSDSNAYFILGELKDRVYSSDVRRDARKQLIATLDIIMQVPAIQSLAGSKINRLCCYFNKQSKAPASLTAISAFNRLPALFPTGFKMSSPPIEALGFDFYEYSGIQTVQLV